MYKIDFSQPIHVHFIGIGGISMSGLADILFSKGFRVSGSDAKASSLTNSLSEKGITINIGQKASNITDDIDLVVYTAAIHADNEEYSEVMRRGIPMLTRAELLGEIMSNYKVSIGVAGTHGKTTTTSMLAEILMASDCDPTISVGGILPSIGGNLRLGASDNFLTEACEYTNSFLSFKPSIEIILNIGEDHMDFFKDINDIRNSFIKYVNLLPEDGLLVINGDIDNVEEIYAQAVCNVITVGKNSSSDYTATDISYDSCGRCSYTLIYKGAPECTVSLGVAGLHNVYNSLAAIAVARHMGLSYDTILPGISNFTGTERRFQKKGMVNGITIIDDYAHHPDEIAATISTAEKYPHKKLTVIFQPHTYTRTKAFLNDFAKTLSRADRIILADIYAARETDTLGISSEDICRLIKEYGTECIYEPDFDRIPTLIKELCSDGDLVITMGAGNIVEVGETLINNP